MTCIENETQYRWALAKVEELLPLVKDISITSLDHQPVQLHVSLIHNDIAQIESGAIVVGGLITDTKVPILRNPSDSITKKCKHDSSLPRSLHHTFI